MSGFTASVLLVTVVSQTAAGWLVASVTYRNMRYLHVGPRGEIEFPAFDVVVDRRNCGRDFCVERERPRRLVLPDTMFHDGEHRVAAAPRGVEPGYVRAAFRDHGNELRYCYSRELPRDPALRGTATARFTIDAAGQPHDVTVEAADKRLGRVAGCIAGKLRTWRFYVPPRSVAARIVYPLTFRTIPVEPPAELTVTLAPPDGAAQLTPELTILNLPQCDDQHKSCRSPGFADAGFDDWPDGYLVSPGTAVCEAPPLDPRLVRRVLHAHRREIGSCVAAAGFVFPSDPFGIVVRFDIDPNGIVADLDIVHAGAENDLLATCIAEHVTTWQFPRPHGGRPLRVVVPYYFVRAGEVE